MNEMLSAQQGKNKDLERTVNDLSNNKENLLREISELKLQLKMAEESRDSTRRNLLEAQRRVKDGDLLNEASRKEVAELKRLLKDEAMEKDAVQNSAIELREIVKASEGTIYISLFGLQGPPGAQNA